MNEMMTERLILRRFQESDGEGLYGYLSDPETVKFEPYEPFTREEAEREAKRRAGDENFWAVCLRDGALIGNLYFARGDFDTWELGYVFHREYWGMGFAAESVKALLGHGFQKLETRRVVALCNPENKRSWKLLERLGFRREGHLRQNIFFFRDEAGAPRWQDTFEYGLLRTEWMEREYGNAGGIGNRHEFRKP